MGGDTHAYSEGIMSQFNDILKFPGFLNKTSQSGLIKKIITYLYPDTCTNLIKIVKKSEILIKN